MRAAPGWPGFQEAPAPSHPPPPTPPPPPSSLPAGEHSIHSGLWGSGNRSRAARHGHPSERGRWEGWPGREAEGPASLRPAGAAGWTLGRGARGRRDCGAAGPPPPGGPRGGAGARGPCPSRQAGAPASCAAPGAPGSAQPRELQAPQLPSGGLPNHLVLSPRQVPKAGEESGLVGTPLPGGLPSLRHSPEGLRKSRTDPSHQAGDILLRPESPWLLSSSPLWVVP